MVCLQARLEEARKARKKLMTRIQELETTSRQRVMDLGAGELTEEGLASLRKEIVEQERLMQG